MNTADIAAYLGNPDFISATINVLSAALWIALFYVASSVPKEACRPIVAALAIAYALHVLHMVNSAAMMPSAYRTFVAEPAHALRLDEMPKSLSEGSVSVGAWLWRKMNWQPAP